MNMHFGGDVVNKFAYSPATQQVKRKVRLHLVRRLQNGNVVAYIPLAYWERGLFTKAIKIGQYRSPEEK